MKKQLKSRFISYLMAAVLLVSVSSPVKAATSVKDLNSSSDYAKASIEKLISYNIIQGDQNCYFNPKEATTRAEMVTFIVKALGIDTQNIPSTATFKDIPTEHWAFKYVEAAYREGIVVGMSTDFFGENELCTREQMAKMFLTSLKSKKYSISDSSELHSQLEKFEDRSKISDWAVDYVALSVKNGILQGTSTTTFGPGELATREQAAVLTDRFIKANLVNGEEISTEERVIESSKGFVFSFANAVKNFNIRKVIDSSGNEVKGNFLNTYNSSGNEVKAESTNIELYAGETYTLVYSFTQVNPDTKDENFVFKQAKIIMPEPKNTGNQVNSGLVKESKGWIYFTTPNQAGSDYELNLYKMKLDGSNLTKLTDDYVSYINVAGDWVYYRNSRNNHHLYKIKTDGSEKTELNTDNSSNILIEGDWIYYSNNSDNSKIYKMKTDGTEKTKITNDTAVYVALDGDYIYYTNVSDGYKLYRIKKDGSMKLKLNDDDSRRINVEDGWIYYIQVLDENSAKERDRVYKIRTDGTDKTLLVNDIVATLNVSDGWAYYTLQNKFTITYGLYKMKVDGTQNTKLLNNPPNDINLSDDWLYFVNRTNMESSFWRMKKDGTKPEWLGVGNPGTAPEAVTPDTEKTIYMSDIIRPFEISDEGVCEVNPQMEIGGVTYTKGYKMYTTNPQNCLVKFNLDKKYSNISGILQTDDKSPKTYLLVEIYADGKLINSYSLNSTDLKVDPINVNWDVTGVKELAVKGYGFTGGRARLDLVNLSLTGNTNLSQEPSLDTPGNQDSELSKEDVIVNLSLLTTEMIQVLVAFPEGVTDVVVTDVSKSNGKFKPFTIKPYGFNFFNRAGTQEPGDVVGLDRFSISEELELTLTYKYNGEQKTTKLIEKVLPIK